MSRAKRKLAWDAKHPDGPPFMSWKERQRLKKNPLVLLRDKARAMVARLVKHNPAFKVHIETLWGPGMSWANYGRKRAKAAGLRPWEIDHRCACAAVGDLTDPAVWARVTAWENLSPMWADENNRKQHR